MEYSIIKDTGEQVDTTGTSFKGEILATYDELVQTFGEPKKGGLEDKVTREWKIRFLNHEVASIYDWKDADCLEGIYRWHIGGFNQLVVIDVLTEYNNKMKEIKEMTMAEKKTSTEAKKEMHYFYLQMESSQMLVAYRDSRDSTEYPTWQWAVTLTTTERRLLDELPGTMDIEPDQSEESFGCNKLHQLRDNIKGDALKEYEVKLDFSYEIDHDFGIAGDITIYGDEGCVIEVEAKNEEDACAKAEELLLDEDDISEITIYTAEEIV